MKPKTLQQIKDQYARSVNYDTFAHFHKYIAIDENGIDQIAKTYAMEMAKHNLSRAAENAISDSSHQVYINGDEYIIVSVDKESILNTEISLL